MTSIFCLLLTFSLSFEPSFSLNITQFYSNLTSQVSSLSQIIVDEFCINSRVGGSKCSSVSSEYRYGVQDYINSLAGHFTFAITHGEDFVSNIFNTINNEINKKISLIERIEDKITSICDTNHFTSHYNNISLENLYFGGGTVRNPIEPVDIEWSDTYNRHVSFNHSFYRIPDDIQYSDAIKTEIMISLELESVFKDNMYNICGGKDNYCIQYFGSVSGVFRNYPGYSVTSNYDPRLREWFIDSSSSTKNVIIIIDSILNGNNNYQKSQIIKELSVNIISTLGDNTYVNIISFNSDGSIILTDCFDSNTLIKINYDTRNELIGFIGDIIIKNSTENTPNIQNAFSKAYDLLQNFDDECRSTVILLTDNLVNNPQNVINNRNFTARVFVYGILDVNNEDKLQQLAESNGGLYVLIEDDNMNLHTKFMTFYLLYDYGVQDSHDVIVSSPYISFVLNRLEITLSKAVFIDNEFVGVIGVDMPIQVLDNLVGNLDIGYSSYYFIINNKGETLSHPDLPSHDDYLSGSITEPIIPDISLLEPSEYTDFGIRENMTLGQQGYKKITAFIRQSAGDVTRNGYLLLEQELLYFYYPLADGQLSIAFVVYTESNIDAPLVPSFGLISVPDIYCDTKGINFNELNKISNCKPSFNIRDRFDKVFECNSYWLNYANIDEKSEDPFYLNKSITFNHSIWRAAPDLYNNKDKATIGNLTCEELENEHNYTNDRGYNGNNLPYNGGLRLNSSIYAARLGGIFGEFVKYAFLGVNITDRKLFSAWLGNYEGIHWSYPGKQLTLTYNPLKRPWYQSSISYPDLFVISTVYADATTNKLAISGGTVIYAPQSNNAYGVQGFGWSFDILQSFFETYLKSCFENNNKCYVIESSGFVVYYFGIENYNITDISITNIFLGQYDMEPTLVQAMINVGFLDTFEWINYQDYTIDFTYTANKDIYFSKQLNFNPQNFSLNSGKFTIHEIEKTNLYVIFIHDYGKTGEYPSDCPDNPLCFNVTTPGCVKDNNNTCLTPDTDVCSPSYNYPTLHRDECPTINFEKLYQEMLAENSKDSMSMCGWKGQTLSPTSFPTRIPTGKFDYNRYYTIELQFDKLTTKSREVLNAANNKTVNKLDNIIENEYFNNPNLQLLGGYFSFDIVITYINDIRINKMGKSYNRKLLQGNTQDSIQYEIWTSDSYQIIFESLHNRETNTITNGTFEYNLMKNIILYLDNNTTDIHVNNIINSSNIVSSDWVVIKHSNNLSYFEKLVGKKLLFFNILVIILSLLIGLLAFIHMKCRLNKPRKVDNVNYKAFFLYTLQVWDFSSDLLFTQTVYQKWKHSNTKDSFEYDLLLFLSITFVVVPWVTNMWSIMMKTEKIKHKFENNLPSTKWFRIHSRKLAILVGLAGGLYPSLHLVNSKCFGLSLLNMGLSKIELSSFLENKVKLNILLENIPQLIIQIIFISIEKSINLPTTMAMITSLLSIITTVLQYRFSKLNQNIVFERYEIKVNVKSNKVKYQTKYKLKRYHFLVQLADKLCFCLSKKYTIHDRVKVLEYLCCISCLCPNHRIINNENRNNTTLFALYSDYDLIDERRLLYRLLLRNMFKYCNISLRDIEIVNVTIQSNYILIIIDYFGKNINFKNLILNNETENDNYTNLSKAIHETWKLKYKYSITLQENTNQWKKRKFLFFKTFQQKEKNIKIIKFDDSIKSLNNLDETQILTVQKRKKKYNFSNSSHMGLYNRSRQLSRQHKHSIEMRKLSQNISDDEYQNMPKETTSFGTVGSDSQMELQIKVANVPVRGVKNSIDITTPTTNEYEE